ncbi:hypothetical protein Leryth_014253 [Lithospermum erythrorhizon]|nr:hypothetical protein Leryth_014253 [Lithospermum erythrorhizon]
MGSRNKRLIFYHHPISTTFFLDAIIPGLKNSLSSALKHFPSLAVIAKKLQNLSTVQMPESTELGGLKMTPLVAFQVTLFPGKGMCITSQHVAGDGYLHALAGSDESPYKELGFTISGIHLRSIKPKDDELVAVHLELFPEDSDKVRTTFVISLEEIQRLKKHVSDRNTSIEHLSTFTVVCGYVWACIIKSGNVVVDEIDENDEHYFVFSADCRGRTNPSIPSNYFGNCLLAIMMSAKNMELSGDEGVVTATSLMGEILQKKSNQDGGVFQGFRTFLMDMAKLKDLNKLFSIAGSPRQNYYNMDFGWGKPRKVEITSIDSTGAISLAGCRDESGGLEIGLALPKRRMDVFTRIFREGLQALKEE